MRKIKLTSEILYIVIYKLILDYMYKTIQVPLFGYNGFKMEGDTVSIFLGWTIYLVTYLMIKSEKSDTSSLFCYTVFYVSVSPFITLYQYNNECKLWMVLAQCLCLIGMNIALCVGKKTRFVSSELAGVTYKNSTLRLVVFGLVLFYFTVTFMKFGMPRLSNLLFEEVYNTRASVSMSTFQSIFQNSICRVIIPLSMLITFREKKWIPFFILAFIQLYTYAVTGFKTYLFIPVVLIGLQFTPNLDLRKSIVKWLPVFLVILVIAFKITNSEMLYAVLGNRVFFLPAKIKYAYFDFFSKNPFVYFSQNSFSRLFGIKSNYNSSIMYLIGQTYFNKPNMWTNTGFMADAYANLGFLGMILIGILLTIMLNILYKQLKYVPKDLQKQLHAIFVTFYISLNDGAAIAVLFSGGLLFAIIVVCYVKFYDKSEFAFNEIGVN